MEYIRPRKRDTTSRTLLTFCFAMLYEVCGCQPDIGEEYIGSHVLQGMCITYSCGPDRTGVRPSRYRFCRAGGGSRRIFILALLLSNSYSTTHFFTRISCNFILTRSEHSSKFSEFENYVFIIVFTFLKYNDISVSYREMILCSFITFN